MITTTILAIVESFLATLAYAILFNVPKQYYTACGITGMAGWLLYLAMCQVTTVALASFVGTLAVVLISRILTVRKKCPITIFLVSGIIPLVPGAGIYYTAYSHGSSTFSAFSLLSSNESGIHLLELIQQK